MSPHPTGRQQPGSACEECRKRKLRCDRQKPHCGTCVDAGIECYVSTNRLARGPKRGDLKALRNRVAVLERCLSLEPTEGNQGANGCEMPFIKSILAAGPHSTSPFTSPRARTNLIWDNEIHVQVPPVTHASVPLAPCPSSLFEFSPSPSSPPRTTLLHDLMRADLDQLYFDRVHPNVPIFNQSRYLSWSPHATCTGGPSHETCLRYAMWTLAMAQSSQFESFRDILYHETRQLLETLDAGENEMGIVHIEQVQAWLLIAFYDFARCSYRRGWVSAGRALRLVQLARLHEVDCPENKVHEEDPVVVEERRRTFWVAYCLDRFISLNSHYSLTLVDEVISTRLPSPELAFQGGHPLQGCFLSEAIASHDHSMLSPLAECAVLANISGRALAHSQSSNNERGATISYGTPVPPMDFWVRHDWLDGMLTKRLESLTRNYPVVSGAVTDPMLLFAFMLAQTTTISMCKILEGSGVIAQCEPAVFEHRKRATRAATDIARLAKAHEQIGYFKAHIFMPLTVFIGAACLISQRAQIMDGLDVAGEGFGLAILEEEGQAFEAELRYCLDALRKMHTFNNIARDHLYLLEARELW
ncbi:fungal-specific transcription factor domain-containing protein [Podospora appendiculata]|uniref:Fungal-specific transcription factor domain-containing protein n=1 Tax=Podospora appendiculata TaxID=314037 RepID=A0AAE1CCI5_9PEZI|nr:fungal-specific transcription factor domain-containing protein [Podospora appendiculata]